MAAPKSTVKSAARVARAKAIIAGLPRDPVTGRMMKRSAVTGGAPPAEPSPTPEPAGGPAETAPFGQAGRGLRHFLRRRTSA